MFFFCLKFISSLSAVVIVFIKIVQCFGSLLGLHLVIGGIRRKRDCVEKTLTRHYAIKEVLCSSPRGVVDKLPAL